MDTRRKTEQDTLRTAPYRLGLAELFGRSLFPFVALALLASTLVWGPWGTLLATFLWWRVVTRVA